MDIASVTQREAVAMRRIAAISNSRIDPKAIRVPGSLANIFTALSIALAEDVEARAFAKLAALTVRNASREDLDAVIAEQSFGLMARKGASASVGTLILSRPPSGSLPVVTFPQGAPVQINDLPFTLDTAISFGSGQWDARSVTCTSVTAGKGANVPASATVKIDNLASYGDTTISAVLAEDTAGGDDREEDEALKNSYARFLDTLSRGTVGAIQFGAERVPGIRQAVCVEPLNLDGEAYNYVICYVSDANGQANSVLVQRVLQQLLDYRCCGMPVRVVGSVPSFQEVVLKILLQPGFDPTTTQNLVVAAVLNAFETTQRSSDPLYRSTIISAVRRVQGVVLPDDGLVKPAADIAGSLSTLYRTRVDLVKFV